MNPVSHNFMNTYADMLRKSRDNDRPICSTIKPFKILPVPEERPKNISHDIEVIMEKKEEVDIVKVETETNKLPALSIENIITTFKVVGGIKEGTKLRIKEDKYLTGETSYFPSFTREADYRHKIISFLRHLFSETERHTKLLMTAIKDGEDVDENISELEKLISNMMIFLHGFETMMGVYRSDESTFGTLGAIEEKFMTFRHSLFRKLALQKN